MTEVNRIAAHYNQDGSLKPKEQVKPEATPVNPAAVDPKPIHQASLDPEVQKGIGLFQSRFDKFIKEESANNDLDVGVRADKSQGQVVLEALFTDIQAANKNVLARKLGNRSILDIEAAIPEAPKVITDILTFVKGQPEAKKIFDEEVKGSILNFIAFATTREQLKQAYAKSDADSRIKVENLSQVVNPFEDMMKVFSAKSAVYMGEVEKLIKPFLENYSALLKAHQNDLVELLKAKTPELKGKLAGLDLTNMAAVTSVVDKLAPEIADVVKSQSTSIGNFFGDWIKENAKPVFGLAMNTIGAVKHTFRNILNTVPGAKETPAGKIFEQFAA